MSRKLLPLAFVLAVAAAACAQAPVEPQLGSGPSFVPIVVDALNDAGRFPSVAVVDGRPVIAYFSFEEVVPEGSFPETRPIGSPSVPGVMLATVQDGVWSRGAIAIEKEISNVRVKFNPAFVGSVGELTPESVTGLQLVADADGGLHALWGSGSGLFYATGTGDPDSTTQWTVEKVTGTPGVGPSLAVDANGDPWIAYYTSSSAIASVEVRTRAGGEWALDTVGSAPGCPGCRTAIAVNGDGDPVVAFGDGPDVTAAVPTGDVWQTTTVERGGSGFGLAAAAAPDGSVILTYETETEVHAAVGPGAGSFRVSTVAPLGQGDVARTLRTTGVAVDEQGAVTATWVDPATGAVQLATSIDGSSFQAVETGDKTLGGGMPSAATTGDGATSYVAWYETGQQDLVLGAYGETGELVIAQPSPTPTEIVQPSGAPSTQECTPVVDGKVTVVALGIAFTDGKCIEAPAGEAFTIVFDNQDAGVQHNVQVFGGAEASGDTLFAGEIITGPDQIEYRIPALDPGEYAYNCVVHPTMIGTIRVGQGGATGATGVTGATGPTGATGDHGGDHGNVTTTVVAQNIAFDTSTITLPADTPTVITLDNRDAGVPHNIAIYTDSSLTEELFQGEIFSGPATREYQIPPLPAGEYYFLCVVHPNMNGTVVVQ